MSEASHAKSRPGPREVRVECRGPFEGTYCKGSFQGTTSVQHSGYRLRVVWGLRVLRVYGFGTEGSRGL